jgi:hypothetical protein
MLWRRRGAPVRDWRPAPKVESREPTSITWPEVTHTHTVISQPQIYQVFWATPEDNKKQENKNIDHLAGCQTHTVILPASKISRSSRCFRQPHKTIKKKRTKTSITWPEVPHTHSHPPSLKNIPKPNSCFGQPHKIMDRKRTKKE